MSRLDPLLVALGGAVGAALREVLVLAGWGLTHPLRTVLVVNLAGAFLLGALLAALGAAGPDTGARRSARLLLGTGLCGGFTTYSALAVQAAETWSTRPAAALALAGVTVGLGALATGVGVLVGARIGTGHRLASTAR